MILNWFQDDRISVLYKIRLFYWKGLFLMLKQSKYWGIYKFIFQTLLYFVILLVLLYFFGFAGHGQGGFIYNEF